MTHQPGQRVPEFGRGHGHRRPWLQHQTTELLAAEPFTLDRDRAELCQLCGHALWGPRCDDGLCGLCRMVLDDEDPQAWRDAGGRCCRRCGREVPLSSAIDGRCWCGGELL